MDNVIRISDVIKRLQQLKDIRGDLPVYAAGIYSGYWQPIKNLEESVYFNEADSGHFGDNPDCVSIDI